jgi:hypothetical protein
MATHLTANDMPFVLLKKNRSITGCYNNIELVTAVPMGNSRKRFGLFTDTVKLPLHEVVWAVPGYWMSTAGLRFLAGTPISP